MSHYAVVNPATQEHGWQAPLLTSEELDDALARSSQCARSWSRRSTVAERAAMVRRAGELHAERRLELALLIVREMGKPIDQALSEIDFCVDIYEYMAETAESALADEEIVLRGGEGRALVRSAPLGSLLGIMPWNFPAYQVARFAGPNLAIGNTILLKHAPQCPASARFLEQIFRDAGFPEDAYINVFVSNEQVADMIADPRVAGVSLTGSERAGQAVAELAGRHLKKVVLELGGSDPFILLSSDDVVAVVEKALVARLDNTGQACNAAKRFIVVDDLYDEFADKFTAALTAKAPNDPTLPGTEMGPLSSAAAAERLATQVASAVEHGATAHGGTARRCTFFSPVVLTDVTAENPAHHDEFFGPVAVLYRASSEEEAITIANDTPFGLGSYVFTTDQTQAMRVADQLDVGMVFINAVLADGAEMPFGGVKRSGVGRELGRFAFNEFVNKKLIRSV